MVLTTSGVALVYGDPRFAGASGARALPGRARSFVLLRRAYASIENGRIVCRVRRTQPVSGIAAAGRRVRRTNARLIVSIRLAGRNAQGRPLVSAPGFRKIHDLADMVTEVRERTM